MGFAIPFFLIRSTSHIRINHQLFFKSGIASKTADWRLSSAFGPPGFQLSSLLTKCPPACSHMATICPQIGIIDGGLRQMLSINKNSQCRRNGKWEIEINQNELYSFSKEIHKRFVDNSLFQPRKIFKQHRTTSLYISILFKFKVYKTTPLIWQSLVKADRRIMCTPSREGCVKTPRRKIPSRKARKSKTQKSRQ